MCTRAEAPCGYRPAFEQSAGDGATRGRLAAGLAADFIVLDADPFSDLEALLTAGIVRTVVGGRTEYDAAWVT